MPSQPSGLANILNDTNANPSLQKQVAKLPKAEVLCQASTFSRTSTLPKRRLSKV